MTREELTKDIIGYEGLYTIDIFGNVIRTKDGNEVPQQKNKFGYMNVSLYKNGKQKQYKVHRLIAQAFIPNPQNKEQVNHIDGNKTHNVVWNLEWCTCKENINHAIKIGLNPKCTPVRIVETGQTYPDITSCAKDIEGDTGDIYKCIVGERKSHKGFHFEKVV